MPSKEATRIAWETERDLTEAAAEQDAFTTRMRKLAATACNVKLNDEVRLKALLTINAEVHRRRTARRDATTGPADKIAIAKHANDERRMLRDKVEALRRGSIRTRRIVGALAIVEPFDTATVAVTHKMPVADGIHCIACGAPLPPTTYKSFQRGRQRLTCGGRCRQRMHRAREAA